MTGVLLFVSALAWGAPPDLDRYPVQAEVTLPESGVVRVHVPPALRSAADPVDGSDLLLVDAAGEPVPFAIVRGEGQEDAVPVDVIPTRSAGVFELRLTGPADAIDVVLPDSFAATARVEVPRGDGWATSRAAVPVWRNGDRHEGRISVPDDARKLRLTLETSTSIVDPPRVTALREVHRAPPDLLVTPMTLWGITEQGEARYAADLGATLPVRRIRPHVAEDVFDRSVTVVGRDEQIVSSYQQIRRVAMGDTLVDDRTVTVFAPLDRFELRVNSHSMPALTIDQVDVELEGVQLLVRDAGVGPHQLYAGADASTRASWDLQTAVDDLLAQAAAAPIEPSEAVPNPAYSPPEVRASLTQPSVPVALDRYRFQHAVPAGSGLARIPLSAEVLAEALPDLRDLRLVDDITAENRQIPFVKRRGATLNSWGALPFTREERGSTSVLRVPVPISDVPVAAVTLRTEATLFSRLVTIERVRGKDRETLRAFQWGAEERPGQVTMVVEEAVGDVLFVTIENGENPPLPISAVEVSWPSWELVAWLPGAPSYLVAGDRQAEAPTYDLALVGSEALSRRAPTAVEIGASEAIPPLPISRWDQVVLFAGIAFTAAGMLALAARIAMAKPPADDESVAPV